MGKKYIFIAVLLSFSILSAAQIPVLGVEKNIFKMDSVFEKEAVSKGYYRSFNRWIRQADFDNDGLLDYLLQPYQNINRGGVISVFYNKSTPTKSEFKNTNKANLYSEGDPGLFDVGDVDGDNRPDILLPTQNYHGKPENKKAEWYTNNPEHTFDKLFLNKGDNFKRVLFPNNYNTESGRLLNINNTPQKEIIISNYDKPKNTDPNHQDPNLLYKYGLINEELYRGTTLMGTDLDLLSRAVQSDEKGGKVFFAIEKRLTNFKDSIFIVSFNKGDSLSLISKHDTVAIITSEKKQKGDYFYNYLPVIDFGIHVVDMDNDGIYEVVTQEFTQIKDLTGKSVELDLGLSHTRIQVYNKNGNESNQWLDSALQYDPVRIAHGNGIKVEDLNNDGLVDILPVNGWGWWGWDNGDTTIKKELLNKRVLLNTGKKIQSFKLDFKNDSDFQALKMGWFFYPIYNTSEKSANILFLSEGSETTFSNWDNTNGIAKIDLSQFQFPCDVYKPEINFQGSLAIPYGADSTIITIDSVAGINTRWYKNNKVVSYSNTIKIKEIGEYKIVRTNLGGCINEKVIIIIKAPQVIVKTKSIKFNFSIPDVGVETSNGQGLGGALNEATSGALLYSIKGKENIIIIPSYSSKPLSPLHFINGTNGWEFKKYYTNVTMGNARNYVFIDSSTIAYADHGLENGNPWPYGDIYTVKNENDTLNWKKISKYKSFYHSVATGDLNNDGLYDLIGLHMGSYDPWIGINNLHPYLQNKDSSFSDGKTILENATFPGENTGAGAVLIADIMGDKTPEIIKSQYGGDPSNPYAYSIFGFDPVTKSYKFLKKPKNKGVFSESKQGSTSIKVADFNKDGKIDMAIASEGYPSTRIQIWQGLGDGEFEPGQILSYHDTATGYPDSSNTFREFEIADVDNDGWLDILVHPFHFGNKFRINPGPKNPNPKNGGWVGSGVYIQNSIWKNQNGTFYTLPDNLAVLGTYPGFMKGFYVNSKLKFFGFEQDQDNQNLHSAKLHEYTVTFCNNLIKPTLQTTTGTKIFSYCEGDTLKLSAASNINKGDTLKWYLDNKLVGNYNTNGISTAFNFIDSGKLYVIKTDSLGCKISSDTVALIKNPIPPAPQLFRDSANNLVSNYATNIWALNGTPLQQYNWPGTNVKLIKPASSGNYTVSTVLKGCFSLKSSYYYLVTDIINLSKDEFIKLAPNPFVNQLNFDFVVKGYQKLNIEVYDVATGSKVANQQNITAGTQIQLSQLARGTYIIRVTSNDNKIAQQFKMVKL